MLTVVILAAGLGKRMKSALPKPLHSLGGKPILSHILEKAKTLEPQKIIVVHGYKGEMLKQHYAEDQAITWVEQKTFLGTGDALKYALPELIPNSKVLLLYGDTPLIDVESLEKLIQNTHEHQLAWLTVEMDHPYGYGRILRDQNNNMHGILEEKDLKSVEEHAIKEVNSGLFSAPESFLQKSIPQLTNQNAQNEYYLTDIVALAYEQKIHIHTEKGCQNTIRGINDKVQLAELERIHQRLQAHELMVQGATLIDPSRIDIRGNVSIGQDVIIDVGVIFEGSVTLEDGVYIGAHSVLRDSHIKKNTQILPFTHIENSIIGEQAQVGPYARIRPQTILSDHTKVGNFVELKNTQLGKNSKINHLSYAGDSVIGENVNIGAGSITCNYDGANKFKTIIEDDVFIGSNTSLIAPLTLEKGATIGAGSTIQEDVQPGDLAFTRAPLTVRQAWLRPKKIKTQ